MSALETKIPPPVLALGLALAMWAASFGAAPLALSGALRWALVAGFFALAALSGGPAVRAFVRARTTIDPVRIERASTLVTSGIYRFTRNPMYVALTSLLLSWAAYLSTPWAFVGPLIFVAFISRFQIIPEERAMTAKFGDAYIQYRNRVRRWV